MVRSLALASMMALSVACAAHSQSELSTPPSAQQIEGIIAVVNDDPISFTDVRQRAR